jgi:hypothetical protein
MEYLNDDEARRQLMLALWRLRRDPTAPRPTPFRISLGPWGSPNLAVLSFRGGGAWTNRLTGACYEHRRTLRRKPRKPARPCHSGGDGGTCPLPDHLRGKNGPVTVRQLYYRAEVEGVAGIDKTDAGYTRIQRQVLALRRAKRLQYRDIADATRWMRKPRTFDNVKEALRSTAQTSRKALWVDAGEYVEVWCEKDALAGGHLPDHQQVRRAAHGGARFCVGNPSALRRSDRLPAILALITGRIGLVEVCRDSLFPKELKRPAPKPVLAIIGDDDHRSTGPAGFPAAERFGHWAPRCNCPRRRRRGRALRQGGPHRTDRSPRAVDPRDGMHPILPGREKLP